MKGYKIASVLMGFAIVVGTVQAAPAVTGGEKECYNTYNAAEAVCESSFPRHNASKQVLTQRQACVDKAKIELNRCKNK